MTAELVLDLKLELGEGPLWDDRRNRLLFVDIMAGDVHEFDPVTKRDRALNIGRPVGCLALTEGSDWIAGAADGFYRVNSQTGDAILIASIEADLPRNRMNDGYVDASGRFWAGTMDMDGKKERGALYRLDPDGRVHLMLSDVSISNGLDWSPDNRVLYYTDLALSRIDKFDFDVASGSITNRRVFVEIPQASGYPDGLIVDTEGFVWTALWDGGAVHRYTTGGQLDSIIEVPAPRTTKCAFGGPDLSDLYVTTAGGGLFHARPCARGKTVHRFAG